MDNKNFMGKWMTGCFLLAVVMFGFTYIDESKYTYREETFIIKDKDEFYHYWSGTNVTRKRQLEVKLVGDNKKWTVDYHRRDFNSLNEGDKINLFMQIDNGKIVDVVDSPSAFDSKKVKYLENK